VANLLTLGVRRGLVWAEGDPFRKCMKMAARAFLIARRNSDLIMTLFLLMVRCQMPQLQNREAIRWIENQLVVRHIAAHGLSCWRHGGALGALVVVAAVALTNAAAWFGAAVVRR